MAESNSVEISRKVPLGETDYGAIDFPKWKNIGVEVLIKSNINNWISCEPISGNFVLYVEGEITCTVLKEVTEKCKGYDQPNAFSETNYGPAFRRFEKDYYFFEGSTINLFPVHDPCGRGEAGQENGVSNPHGNIFIR